MTTSRSDLETFSAQIGRLERQVLFLKRSGVLVVGAMLVAFIFGQAAPVSSQTAGIRVVEAEKFILKDSKGRVRGEWEVEDFPQLARDRVSLRLRSSEGKIAASLQNPSWESARLTILNRSTPEKTLPEQPEPDEWAELLSFMGMLVHPVAQLDSKGLFIADKDNLNSASIKVRDAPEIDLHGRRGSLAISGSAAPTITMSLNGLNADSIWSLSDTGMALVARFDKKPRALWQVGKDANKIELYDPKGNTRAVLGTTDISTIATGESHSRKESSLVLFGEDGNVVFSAP